jgi:hypothetical protein
VAGICDQAFLSLWSYPNPLKGPGKKELCDCLVVCDPDVIILSVKEIAVTESGDLGTDWERWRRKAIDASVKQIYGAERVLRTASHVTAKDGQKRLPLPDAAVRRVHRIAVALGGQGKVPLTYGDFGKGFVHVLDERSFEVILGELDTITDLVQYLRAKEAFLQGETHVILEGGGEEDLLAVYLSNGRSFPTETDMLWLGPDLWTTFSSDLPYRRKKDADKQSYVWDRMIEEFCECEREGTLLGNSDLDSMEQAIRTMAREDRFARRGLARSFLDFLKASQEASVRARLHQPRLGTPYVFLACPKDTPREARVAELNLRCLVARGRIGKQPTVIGIGTERLGQEGHSLDLVYLHIPEWTAEQDAQASEIQRQYGYFLSPKVKRGSEDEYPKD